MSYPNFRSADVGLEKLPDLRLIAALAEDAGVDLRIVLLIRDAQALLVSTAVHRTFAPWAEQAQTLRLSANALTAQLQVRAVPRDALSPALRPAVSLPRAGLHVAPLRSTA